MATLLAFALGVAAGGAPVGVWAWRRKWDECARQYDAGLAEGRRQAALDPVPDDRAGVGL